MKSFCIGISTESVNEIKENIEEWLASPNRYDKMAEEAYNFAINNCTIGVMAEKTLETYRKAVITCFN
jgi:glycosyltransferase involved in cell wall biosynthesis